MTPKTPGRLAAIQQRILERAAAKVAPGGQLVYAVCSIEPEEGPRVVERFLARHSGFREEPERRLRLLPGAHGMDGFYAARLARG
jgi:16S rRNA (cytosine967-C5)-methyltransferase